MFVPARCLSAWTSAPGTPSPLGSNERREPRVPASRADFELPLSRQARELLRPGWRGAAREKERLPSAATGARFVAAAPATANWSRLSEVKVRLTDPMRIVRGWLPPEFGTRGCPGLLHGVRASFHPPRSPDGGAP